MQATIVRCWSVKEEGWQVIYLQTRQKKKKVWSGAGCYGQ